MNKIKNLKSIIENNKVIIENYFFMTVLQILNSFFYLFIYPFLIKTLGVSSYGLYVYILSIATFFISIVTFGFDLPAVKIIAQFPNNILKISHTVSCVFTAKVLLEFFSLIIFSILIFSIPHLRANWVLLYVVFAQSFTNIIFPQWYFQGVQRMRYVTYIQLAFKFISLPFIFVFIDNSDDVLSFAIITTLASLSGGIVAAYFLRYKENVKIIWIPFNQLKSWYRDSFPFFLSASVGILKEQSIIILIGSFFGLKDVAVYDLANKIIAIPRLLFASVNGAMFPKIMENYKNNVVKKVLRFQVFICLAVIFFIILFGKWFVVLLGGSSMLDSYPISIILSVTILSWVVVGSYINFIFVPNNRFYIVAKNQLVALLSLVIYCVIGMFFYKNLIVLAIAMSLSGLTEIVYCKFVIKNENLLR